MVNLTTHELRLVAKNRGIKNYKNMLREELLSGFDELDGNFKTLSEKGLDRIAKMQNFSHNDLDQIIKIHDRSRDELERIAKMRRIKNYQGISQEELIIALLKSKRSIAELFNNNLDNDKISDINKILKRLRDILTKIYRKEIKKMLYEIEHKENLSEQEKEEIDEYFTKLVRTLNKIEECRHHDRDDLDYYGIRDIKNLFSDIYDYYKPILVKSSFRKITKYMKVEETKKEIYQQKDI